MAGRFSRTELLLGTDAITKLAGRTVMIFGIGGVGSFVVEGLVRSGVGHFVLVDDDLICLTNINRQLHATSKTVGRAKVEVMKERIL
ncbi:MAG: tRNA threonylcarbamoyladenosine dehydratase, partial [Selenomonadaceae bacterium]